MKNVRKDKHLSLSSLILTVAFIVFISISVCELVCLLPETVSGFFVMFVLLFGNFICGVVLVTDVAPFIFALIRLDKEARSACKTTTPVDENK